ncbi:uncharacterized protein LOC131884152 [Tigriopus californicus]|uniref:uncharacterized protein LOC131884152 n=1 Tax=Tigriopus californicus TaxID=6832 RepID=UPI0027DA1F69|nr:uncharacterized protein LOC131884152 [Tigriopus californicus]
MKFGESAHRWVRAAFWREQVIRGETLRSRFPIPVLLTKWGLTLKVGQIIWFEKESRAAIQEISVSRDLEIVVLDLIVVDANGRKNRGDHLTLNIQELDRSLHHANERPTFLRSVLNDAQGILLQIGAYPESIRRFLRKHQLTALIRKNVQIALQGFASMHDFSLGPTDFAHDPHIFGLEASTLFSCDHHIEEYASHSSLMDILLKPNWDWRPVASNAGFRIVLTFRMWIDCEGLIRMFVHVEQCHGEPDARWDMMDPLTPRQIYLALNRSLTHSIQPSSSPSNPHSHVRGCSRETLNWAGQDLKRDPQCYPGATNSLDYDEIIEDLEDKQPLPDVTVSSAEEAMEQVPDPGDPLASSSFTSDHPSVVQRVSKCSKNVSWEQGLTLDETAGL